MSRGTWRVGAALLLALVLAAPGCFKRPGRPPHPAIGELYRKFLKLPHERAMAVAGDLDRIWVGSAAGAAATRQNAVDTALAECRLKRKQRRMRAPCLLYAVGDEIVWPNL